MRNVADTVAIEVVAAIAVPVISCERRRRRLTVGREIEAVLGEVVLLEAAIAGARLELYRPAVADEVVVHRDQSIRAVGEQTRRVVREHIAFEPRVADLLEQ